MQMGYENNKIKRGMITGTRNEIARSFEFNHWPGPGTPGSSMDEKSRLRHYSVLWPSYPDLFSHGQSSLPTCFPRQKSWHGTGHLVPEKDKWAFLCAQPRPRSRERTS